MPGTTPMNMRFDALTAASELVIEVGEKLRKYDVCGTSSRYGW